MIILYLIIAVFFASFLGHEDLGGGFLGSAMWGLFWPVTLVWFAFLWWANWK